MKLLAEPSACPVRKTPSQLHVSVHHTGAHSFIFCCQRSFTLYINSIGHFCGSRNLYHLTETHTTMPKPIPPCQNPYRHAETHTNIPKPIPPCRNPYHHAETHTAMPKPIPPYRNPSHHAATHTTMPKPIPPC